MVKKNMNDNIDRSHLEPRVARLETGLETLTRNVSDLTVTLREYASETNHKLDTLSVSVTTAAGPRRTDWSVIFAGIALIIAIGAAAIVPLNNSTNDNKSNISRTDDILSDHMKLNLHPVGAALLQRLEEQIVAHTVANERTMKEHIERDVQTFTDLNQKCHTELELVTKNLEQQLDAVNKHLTFFTEKVLIRVEKIDTRNLSIDDKNDDELRQWRNKASGLNTPTPGVPLRPIQRPMAPAPVK